MTPAWLKSLRLRNPLTFLYLWLPFLALMSLREAFKKTCSGNEKCPYWALLPYWALFTYIATYWAAKNVLKQKQVSSNTTSTLQQCPVIWPLLYSSGNYPKLCNPAAIVIRVVTRAAVSDTASLQTGTVGHSRWGGDTELSTVPNQAAVPGQSPLILFSTQDLVVRGAQN